ncbi:uncharacterized protein LOC133205247 [Saccostrea echinata]|uniref:uncharacterized protein LOC133205247 n=1 Tax=Saccostrea echinata TaxID=191078 RepID=UPI002A8414CA|nr:uncharacterized protein LOC133205247 [Saccostrea echinata]
MQRKKKQQNSPTVVTVYDYSDETLIFESYSSNETNVKKLKSGEIPQDSGTESGRRTQEKRNIIETTRSETEYDHLHQKNGPSTSAADNMYSRMEDNQHGPQSLSDDTYDHTFGMESKCTSSQINHSVNDFYDQAHVSEKMTSTTDDFYTHVTGDQIASRNILLDYTYDRTVEIESTCRYGTSLGDNNINNIYDQAQILTETLDSPKNNYQDPETFYDQAT